MRIAVIPARGGSKRIPRKNIKLFCGKPIVAYSIEAAKLSGLFDKIIVSTDSNEIASIARDYGADTPFMRPNNLSDDFTGTNAVVKHAIHWYHENDTNIDFACCIYPTAPLIRSEYLVEGLEKLTTSNKEFAFSVTTFPFPIQRALVIDKDGSVQPLNPRNNSIRSQDLIETYHDAGQFYWGKASAFLNDETLFSNASLPVVLPRHLVQDIDTTEDWTRAELMYSAFVSQKGPSRYG